MAKELAIKIKFTSDGQEKVIKNISELEKEIESLSEEIKTLDFGSAEYEQAAQNLSKLRAGLRDVDKEIEGLDREQRLTALAGATELVSGSFLIAASAARTFGASAQSVEQIEELERQALEAVNIALGIRQVAEGLVQIQQLKRIATETAANVQTRIAATLQTAYAAAVGTSTGALKLFRLALVATGIGAAIVAIGLLIANWDKLTKAIGLSSEELDDFAKTNIEAQKQTAKTRVELDFYASVVNDVTKSENERLQALEELNKLGVITEDITLDQVDALDKLNERLILVRDNILLKAQAEAASQLLTEAIKQSLDAQNSTLEENLTFWDRLKGLVATIYGGQVIGQAVQVNEALENQNELINQTNEDVQKFEALYLDILDKLNQNEAKLRVEREKSNKVTQTSNTQKQKTLDLDAELNKITEERAKLLEKVRRETQLLATAERDEIKSIEIANKVIEDQNKLLEERLSILGTTQGESEDFIQNLTRLLVGVEVPNIADTFNFLFEYIESDELLRNLGESQRKLIDDGTEFGKLLTRNGFELTNLVAIRQVLANQKNIEIIGEEQAQIILDFFDTQVKLSETAEEYNEILDERIQSGNDELSVLQGKLSTQLETGEITAKEYTQGLNRLQIEREKLEVFNQLRIQTVDYNFLLREVVDLQDNSLQNGLSTLDLQEKITRLVAKRLFDANDLNELEDGQLEFVEKTTQALLDQSKVYNQVRDVSEELLKLNTQISENADIQNQKLTQAQFKQLQAFVIANKDKIDEIERFFRVATVETTNLTQEQIDAINKLIDGIKFDSLISRISDVTNEIVNVFNGITSQLQGIISDSISLQLEQLDYYGQQTLAEIGDETEKQRALQEQFRKDLEKERFDINKRARLNELKFSQAQAIANGAQAVVNALANVPAPFGQILAGVYAGLTAAQVTVIRDQIQFVQGTQFQARRGGLVMGASHEMGGVPMGGGLELEGGEAIINRNAVSQFSDLLSQINLSTGGRAIQSNVNDSEIAQEIRKQNTRPIKTYVLYNDIQDTNKINSKLEQISRL